MPFTRNITPRTLRFGKTEPSERAPHISIIDICVHKNRNDNPDAWVDAYYVQDQGLSPEDGRFVHDSGGRPGYPGDWSPIVAFVQDTVNLLAAASGRPSFDARQLFDFRFQRAGGRCGERRLRAALSWHSYRCPPTTALFQGAFRWNAAFRSCRFRVAGT